MSLPTASEGQSQEKGSRARAMSGLGLASRFPSLEPARAFMQSVADMPGKQVTRLAWRVPGAVPERLANAPHAAAHLLRCKLPWHMDADSGEAVPSPDVRDDDVPDDATRPRPWAPQHRSYGRRRASVAA